MAFLNTNDLANAQSFLARVKVALVKQAGVVISENTDQMNANRAMKRYILATDCFRDPDAATRRFIWPVVANPAIAQVGLDAPDTDLEYQVAVVWDSVAGVQLSEQEPVV